MTVPPIRGYSPSAAIPMVGEAFLEFFDRAPIGLFLLDSDRRIIRANEALAELTGIAASILPESSLRRLLSPEAPLDLEDRIFEELSRSNQWDGELEMRTSIGDTSPMKVSITPVGSDGKGPVRYVATVIELGEQRWIEAESSRRAAELAAFASIAVAAGSSVDPNEMLNTVARSIVDRLEVDACWIHRYEAAHSHISLAGEASYLSGSLRLSPTMIPDAVNPAVLRTIETREQTTESELLDRSIATIVHAPLLALDEIVGRLAKGARKHPVEMVRREAGFAGSVGQMNRLVQAGGQKITERTIDMNRRDFSKALAIGLGAAGVPAWRRRRWAWRHGRALVAGRSPARNVILDERSGRWTPHGDA